MKIYHQIPDPVDIGEIYPDCFSIVIPEATTNLITNPSMEFSADDYAGDEATLDRTSTITRRGQHALRVTAAAGDNGRVYFSAVALTAKTAYTFSLDLLGKPGWTYRLYAMTTTGGARISEYKTVRGKGFWERVSVALHPQTTVNHTLYLERYSPTTEDSYFYTDGWQVEAKP